VEFRKATRDMFGEFFRPAQPASLFRMLGAAAAFGAERHASGDTKSTFLLRHESTWNCCTFMYMCAGAREGRVRGGGSADPLKFRA